EKTVMPKPVILTFVDYYLPGYKAGGPIRTIANMVERLSESLSFRVVTRDRDHGDTEPYPNCQTGTWIPVGKSDVMYLAPHETSFGRLRTVLNQTRYKVLYLNSLFSRLSIRLLLLRRLRLIRPCPIVLAPRGELAASALARRPMRKRAYLRLAKILSLFRGITWQASSRYEQTDIRKRIARSASVAIAEDLSPRIGMGEETQPHRPKRPGVLDVLFLSRIHRVKNLDYAIRILGDLKGQITLNVYGPVEDRAYWDECRELIERMPANVTVCYRGAVANEQVRPIMRDHDLFLLPTRGENFGHVILEALLAGCPVLTSDQTPWRGLQEKGVGWDLPLTDSERFRSVLQEIVNMDEFQHHRLSQRVAAFARQTCLDETRLKRNRMLFLKTKEDFEERRETDFRSDDQSRAAALVTAIVLETLKGVSDGI
ncbi:MAG: glycosyltransferase, partial [Proteobacteria bacterium]|nr:glycosyltransferase [Pseudomonadota bacterium]